MNISAHEANNEFYYPGGTPWAFGWTCQQLVTSTIVTATGGTYETKAPKVKEKSKKIAETNN